MSLRDPKIFIIEVHHKNPFKYNGLVGDYLVDVSIRSAFFSTTKHIDCANTFSLDEASIICSNFNKMHPEHFICKLNSTFKVPIEYGKDNYTLSSKFNDDNFSRNNINPCDTNVSTK